MTDCLIVGAGVIGLSLACELTRHGARVRVIDCRAPGQEASWAGAGILPPANPQTALHPLERLRALSCQLHPQWSAMLLEETGIDNGYDKCGGVYVARTAGEAAALLGFQDLLDDEQIAVRRLAPGELAELEPALRHLAHDDRLKAAYLLPDEAQLRNPRHLRALLKFCHNHGVDVQDDTAATGFRLDAGRLQAVCTDRGEVTADRFCLTAGAWTQALLAKVGVITGILPIRGQMVLYRCARRPFQRVINEGPRYLVPRDDGRVLAGSTEEEAGFDKSTTSDGIGELMTMAQQLVPQLTPDLVERTWAGLRPGTFDGLPYLGAVPGLDNAFVAAGHFRSGLHMSPGTAVVLSQLIRGEPPSIDLTPFRIGRG